MTSNPQEDDEKEGLLDSVLPSPTHPRATRRALSLGVISIFLMLVVWMAFTSKTLNDMDNVNGAQTSIRQGWVYGVTETEASKDKGAVSVTEDVVEGVEGLGELNSTEASSGGESSSDDEDTPEELASIDSLAHYVWHQDLEWDADGFGRLIVIGDVHGMVDALK